MRFSKLFSLIGLFLCLFAFNALAVTYEYDDLNRLTKAVYDDGSAIVYTYDNAGNRLTQQITPGQPSRLAIEVRTSHDYLLQNVRVYAFTAAGRYTGIYAVTDSEGLASFELKDFQPGQYKFRADYLSGQFWTPWLSLPNTTQYSLVIEEATATVTVEVAGEVKAGVKVYLFNDQGTYLGLYGTTDSQGQVVFNLPIGYTFKFRADTLASQYWSPAVLINPGVPNPILVNAGGGILTLTLEKDPNTPLPGLKTYMFNTAGTYLGLSNTSDAEGRAAFTLSQGQYKTRIDYLGYQVWSEPISLNQDLNQTVTIPHQDVTILVQTDYDHNLTPKPGLKIYLYNNANTYVGLSQTTNDQGQGIFNLPQQEYKVRVDYLSRKYWFEPFIWQDQNPTIPEGLARVTVTGMNQPLQDIKVYAFNTQAAYLGLMQTTNEQGLAEFQLPEGQYKFRADYLGNQYWSDPTGIQAHSINPVTLATGGGNFILSLYKDENTPLVGIKCYLFNAAGTYLGQQANTNDQGRVNFSPANGDYKIRVDYLGYQYWTDLFSIPAHTGLTLTITHQGVVLSLKSDYILDKQPLQNIRVYLFKPNNSYQGLYANTDDQGQASFNLPQQEYKLRADYLGYQFWSEPFIWLNKEVAIAHGQALVHVSQGGRNIATAKVYLFKPDGTYLGQSRTTDNNGQVQFLLPDQAYKFRVDYNGKQYWSSEVTITPDQVNGIEVVID